MILCRLHLELRRQIMIHSNFFFALSLSILRDNNIRFLRPWLPMLNDVKRFIEFRFIIIYIYWLLSLFSERLFALKYLHWCPLHPPISLMLLLLIPIIFTAAELFQVEIRSELSQSFNSELLKHCVFIFHVPVLHTW